MKTPQYSINRRTFIQRSAHGAGVLAFGRAALDFSPRAYSADRAANPFAYEVEYLAKTDPALLKYEEVRRFAVPGPEPRRIDIGPGDRLYVATEKGVNILDAKGGPVGDLPTSEPARCVGVAPDGMVYVGLRDHIEVFDSRFAPAGAWQSPARKTWLTGLALKGSDLFAADSGNRVVLRYDRSGKLNGRIGEKNHDRNVPGLVVPSPYLDIVPAPDGLIRVADPGRHRVEAYTLDGDLEFSWGKPSNAIDGFCGCCNPIGLTILPDGKFVTCEKGLPRVKVYQADGTFESVVAGTESFPENARRGSARNPSDGMMGGLDAAVDSQGMIYILDLVARDVRVMRRKG